ncbi:hypothetical protein BOTBODRAFT_51070 [Botryobasidium botryosum FD-172 SS1]|uniref:F-box domain-containing protein n=1 Tax=Botryobasidium botryosum (strain FD-172 SS1) TaxID=930990 RepID=A0A067NAA1_BOTB1|nr:hypothetical protein BOTBODRAFT_51070 [Botryobasidium botryosum FD-172 SS1]
MLITSLPDDVLHTILSMHIDAQSLLSFALLSRRMCRIIIPTYLYARIRIKDPRDLVASSRLEAFLRCISTADAPARTASIRTIEITAEYDPSWGVIRIGDAFEKMHNLRRVCICPFNRLVFVEPRMPHLLMSLGHLHHLCLKFEGKLWHCLDLLQDLVSLQYLEIGRASPRCGYIPLNAPRGPALENMLINSRETLREIHVFVYIALDFDLLTWSYSADSGAFVWPHLHTLSVAVRPSSPDLDLARAFPSLQQLGPIIPLEWVEQGRISPLVAHLEFLRATWDTAIGMLAVGAKLRRLRVLDDPLPMGFSDDLKKHSAPCLRSLHICYISSLTRGSLAPFAEFAPHLTFIHIEFFWERSEDDFLETLTTLVMGLPLKYIWLTVTHRGDLGISSGHDVPWMPVMSWERIVSLVDSLIPSLQGVRIDLLDDSYCRHWRKVVGEQGGPAHRFIEQLEADGLLDKKHYEMNFE